MQPEVEDTPTAERDDIISMKELRARLEQTIQRVNETKQPMYVAVRGSPGVAIVDLDEYRELERLAERGLIAELVERVERDEAEGALVPWEVVNEELQQMIEKRRREENS